MALTSLRHCAFFYVFLFQLSFFVSLSKRIQILSEYETIIHSGDNHTIMCQGNAALNWTIPEVKDGQWTTVKVVDVLPQNVSYKYGSKLFLYDVTFEFTGFYKCYEEGDDPFGDNSGESVFLYVRDEEHLSVNTDSTITVLVTQYDVAILPCRPTSPDVTVELTLIGGEKIFLGILNEEGTLYRYHPHYGFITNNTKDRDQFLHFCNFSRGSHSFVVTIILEVEQIIHSVPKPMVMEVSDGHTIVGGKLVLECRVRAVTYVAIDWTTPTGPLDPSRMVTTRQKKVSSEDYMVFQQLTINHTLPSDKGVYTCNVSDNQNHISTNSISVNIYGPKDHFINLTEENDVYQISERAGSEVQWRIDVKGHPQPKLFWLNNRNESISSDRRDKYETNLTPNEALLKIKDLMITDYGNYTLVAENSFETRTLALFLNVTDKPTVAIESGTYHMIDTEASIKCRVAAYPAATVFWSFKPCLDNSCKFESLDETAATKNGLQVVSSVAIKALNSGYVKCLARNALGEDATVHSFLVTDVRNGLDIFGFDDSVNLNERGDEVEVSVGSDIKMSCGASIHHYTADINWIPPALKDAEQRLRIDRSRTEYSDRVTLNIASISSEDSGRYSCEVNTKDGEVVYRNITVVVSDPVKPLWKTTNMNKDMDIPLPNNVTLFCKVAGVPKPTVSWFLNDGPIHPSASILFTDNNQKVEFKSLTYDDEGTYKCRANNKAGSVSKQINITFKNKPGINRTMIIIISCLVVLVVLAAVALTYKIYTEKKLERELQIAELLNFEKGAIENLNPDLGIDDQAELLPYDKKWEIPIENLKLGKQLGSGAFGVVMKGVARNIVEGEESTTVAVKMVKKNAGSMYIKALASELKIMVHLGKHLNVVNLLGACTRNVAKRELLVIVEFCRYGNLQNYLLRHRENFIDQVNPKTGHIDFMVGQEVLERSYSMASSRSAQSPSMKYAALSFSDNADMGDYRGDNYNVTSAKTDITTVSLSPNSDDGMVLSTNSSAQPEWRSNYHGDYKDNVQPICTKDLLAWAFQVCRGMEYLASRKVLHGDLAARNVLLADNNVVKICDFGLAKSMYKSDNYKKKGDGPLPVKWMAIESIRDKMFSTQSDVWSFGIVLWEFFSLARTPYPGMEADERLYNKLLEGYRMEKPDFAPKEMHKMMLDCWHVKPMERPTFSKLSERIGSMLEDTVRKHYIDLNDPYLIMNTQGVEDNDYLAMLSPPNFDSLSSPHNYINDLPSNEGTPGYMCMNSSGIFSPRIEDNQIFDFNINKTKKDTEGGTRNELVPMLAIHGESDSESACNSPAAPNSFSNPSYHLPPVVEKEACKAEKEIVFADNYVNVPHKTALKEKASFVTLDYVNSNSRDWERIKL